MIFWRGSYDVSGMALVVLTKRKDSRGLHGVSDYRAMTATALRLRLTGGRFEDANLRMRAWNSNVPSNVTISWSITWPTIPEIKHYAVPLRVREHSMHTVWVPLWTPGPSSLYCCDPLQVADLIGLLRYRWVRHVFVYTEPRELWL